MYELSENYAEMRENIVDQSKEHLTRQGVKCLVIGMSGGIDSTLVAALMRETGVRVIGVTIPLDGNKSDEVSRSRIAATYLCDIHIPVDMDDVVEKLIDEIIPNEYSYIVKDQISSRCSAEVMKIRKGNVKARARMIRLFDIARANDGLVLSTDNLTEYMLGFWTLHGDVGNFGPVQQLWKTEVYGLAKFLADEYATKGMDNKAHSLYDCIAAMPTDGLGITTSDFDQIMPGQDEQKSPKERYREVDDILIRYLSCKGSSLGDLVEREMLKKHPVIQKHLASAFKRKDPVNLSRDSMI